MTATLKKQRRLHLSTLHWAVCPRPECDGWESDKSADIADAKHAATKHNMLHRHLELVREVAADA